MRQPASGPWPSGTRLPSLDLLRLLAVVLVLGRHMSSPPESWPAIVRLPLLLWIQGGWVGVDLFFVLSGFLVSGLLFNEYKSCGSLGVGRFYMRRGWKIYPPFFVLLAISIAVAVPRWQTIPIAPIVSELFFLQSYMPGLWGHTWSLAVEEHFYVLLPLTLVSILRWNRGSATPLRPVLAIATVVAVASLGLRLLNWYRLPAYDQLTHLFASHLRFDSLFFGVAISYLYHFHPESFARRYAPWRKALITGGGVLLAPAFAFPLETTPFISTLGLSTFYVGSGMLLVGVLHSRIPAHRSVVLMATLGSFSYSVYLWHLPVLVWGIPIAERALGAPLTFGAGFLVYFGGSFFLGILMAKLVEVPVLRLRDRWFPSRGPGAMLGATD